MFIQDDTLHIDHDVIDQHSYHFDILIEIVKKLEGDCLYKDQTFYKHHGLIIKQENLFSIAKEGDKILEIDICEHSYSKPCAEYLQSVFPNRLTLLDDLLTKDRICFTLMDVMIDVSLNPIFNRVGNLLITTFQINKVSLFLMILGY